MTINDGADVSVACAQCGIKHKKSVAWIRANRKIACTCGATTDFDSDAIVRGAAARITAPASFRTKPRSFGRR